MSPLEVVFPPPPPEPVTSAVPPFTLVKLIGMVATAGARGRCGAFVIAAAWGPDETTADTVAPAGGHAEDIEAVTALYRDGICVWRRG